METQEPKKLRPTDIITPDARLSFPSLFQASAVLDSKVLKFGCTLLLPPDTDLKPFKLAMKAAMEAEWGKVIQLPASKNPLHACETYPYPNGRYSGYEDGWHFIRVSSKYRPAIVNRGNIPVTDEEQVYPGMWVRGFINAYAWTHPTGGKGVSFGLQALQLVRDGERLDGRVDASSIFTPLEDLGDGEDTERGAGKDDELGDMFA